MAKRYAVCVFALCFGASVVLSYAGSQLAQQRRALLRALGGGPRFPEPISATPRSAPPRAFSVPLSFEPCQGAACDGAQFVGRGTKMDVALTSRGIEFAAGPKRTAHSGVALLRIALAASADGTGFAWRGVSKLPGETNYLLGVDRAKWRRHVPHFARAEAKAREMGISVYAQGQAIEYDLRIPREGDTSSIRLALSGARDERLDADGNVVMRVGEAEFHMKRPAIYEETSLAGRIGGLGPVFAEPRAENDDRDPFPRENRAVSPQKRRSRASHRARRASGKARSRPSRSSGRRTGLARHRSRRAGSTRASSRRRTRTARSSRRRPAKRTTASHSGRATDPQSPEGRRRKALRGGYVIETDGTIGFWVAGRDSRATLVIDPTISLAYSSFVGGAGTETVSSIAADSTGKIYIGGTTTSPTTFPEMKTQLGPGVPPSNGSSGTAREFFVAKIDPAQTGADSLVYLTFLGGSTDQAGGLIAVDAAGDVAITGTTTSTDFPVTDASVRTSGANDTTVSEIDPTGSTLLYSTLLGGSGAESQQGPGGIAMDASGDIYVASDTNSADLPATAGAYATTYVSSITDGFIAIFRPASTPALQYCTYLGLNQQVGLNAIAVDASGSAYIAGFTSDPMGTFPSKNAAQSVYQGGAFDAFLMKIAPKGNGATDLIYATLLGGSGSDQAFAVTVDSASPPDAYVTGTTSSTNFPTAGTVAAYQPNLPSNATALTSDAFVTVVAQSGVTGQTFLAYSTYLGGSQTDTGYGIEAAEPYAVYVTGAANSWDFPWRDNFQPFNGYGNAFVAKLDTTTAGAGSLIYSTPLGGTSPAGVSAGSQASAIAIDTSGNVWVAGQTTSLDFPSAKNPGNGFQSICGSCQESPMVADAFVAEIQENVSAQLPSLYFAAPGLPLNFGKQAIGATNIPPQFAAIKNGGEAALTISAVGITGPNSGDFSLSSASGCTTGSVSPGGLCSFEVSYIPSVAGPEEAFVQVTSNAPGSPQVLEVIGTGAGLAAIPGNLVFPKQIAGTTSAPQSVTLTNTGSASLYIDSITEGGANPALFAPANTSQQCVAGANGLLAGSSCLIAVTFSPTSAGTFTAEIDIQYQLYGLPEREQIISLIGVGAAAAPVAAILPASLDFGSATTGTTTGDQVVTLTNTGSTALDLIGVSISGPNAAEFSIVTAGTTPCPAASGSLTVTTSCTVGVEFAPKTAGAKSATLNFSDNAAGSPQAVALTGTAQPPGGIQIAPATLTFAAQAVGTKSPVQTVTIANAGGSALALNGISLTGTNAADFIETTNCPPSLATNANCAVNLVFEPSSPGARSASLRIADDGAGSPQAVPLMGTATQPGVTLSSSSVSFGNQAVGTPSSAVSVTVTNSGNGALAVSGISLAGMNSGDFSETDNCTGSAAQNGVAAGGTCAIQITFKPACGTATAARTATLSLADNAPGSPQSVALSGTGTGAFCLMVAPGSSASAGVSPGETGSYAIQVEAANGFTGNVGVTCSGAPANATCTVTPASVNIGGSELAPLQVAVTTSAGTSAAALRSPKGSHDGLSQALVWSLFMSVLMAFLLALRRSGEGFIANSPFRLSHCRAIRRAIVLACATCAVAAALAACGGGGSTSVVSDPATPAGTYTISVTGTTGTGTSQSIMLSLTVE
jgi:hypothetical protein